MLNSEPAPDSEQIIAAFTVIGERGRAALAHMRQLLTVLRETGFSDEGCMKAHNPTCNCDRLLLCPAR